MKKAESSSTKRKTRRATPSKDKVAKEFAEIKARKISSKKLVWGFCLTAADEEQLQASTEDSVEFLARILEKRCRAAAETTTIDHKKKLQHIFLKIPTPTPALLRKLDRGMADCCKGTKVKYNFMGYVEEIYAWDSWKTLGTVIRAAKPTVESIGDLDCRELRFDGLYYNDLGGGGDYLRFYPDGEFVSAAVSGDESVSDVARWLRRQHKYSTVGTFTLKVKSLQGEYQVESDPGEEPIHIKLKARLTKQGLKVRTWSSYSNEETDAVYAFHDVKLR